MDFKKLISENIDNPAELEKIKEKYLFEKILSDIGVKL